MKLNEFERRHIFESENQWKDLGKKLDCTAV
jgi:hypothetical protein